MPTTNYIKPNAAIGTCALNAITNAMEAVQYRTMAEFIKVLAISRGIGANNQIMLYQ